MVLTSVSVLVAPARHQTALRGQAPDPSRSTTVHVNRRRLRNLSVPHSRLLKSTCSIPKGGNGNPEARRRGNRDPRASGDDSGSTASAQLDFGSAGGPYRRGDGPARSIVLVPVTGEGDRKS